MFSHPWTDQASPVSSSSGINKEGGSSTTAVASALRRVRLLNDQLKERSRYLLEADKGGKGKGNSRGALGGKGEAGGGDTGGAGGGEDFGSFDFNVALINRMEPLEERPDLKLEPTFGQDRSVQLVDLSAVVYAASCMKTYGIKEEIS